jgi:zinc protease
MLAHVWKAPDGIDLEQARIADLMTEVFRLKAIEALREREAFTYSPSVFNVSSSDFEGYGYVAARVDLDPVALESASRVIAEMAQEMASGDITEDELTRALTPIMERLNNRENQNSYWFGVVSELQTDPRALDAHRTAREMYQSITVEQLREMARGVFTATPIRIHILPEEE